MTREAILLANTAKSSDPRLSVNLSQVNKYINDITTTLAQLGEHSFKVTSIIDKTHGETITNLNRAAQRIGDRFSKEKAEDDSSCLLFYYFGHGVERNNELYFIFKDSDTSRLPTMVSFARVAEILFGFGIPKVLFILDCCYAGAAVYRVNTTVGPGYKYSVLASAIPAQRAAVMEGSAPFGAFSLFLFSGLKDLNAANPPSKQITVDSLFKYVKERLKDEGFEQEPYKIDGGLDDSTISMAIPQIYYDKRFNEKAAKKCFYKKLWWIGSTIHRKGKMKRNTLYNMILREKPIEFMTPIKRGNATIYEPVRQSTFDNYVSQLITLGIIADGDLLELTSNGRALFLNNGARFNEILINLINDQFQLYGSTIENLDSLVRYKIQSRGIPTASQLYIDARRIDKLLSAEQTLMRSDWFRVLIELLGQAGYFRFASQKTFFAY